MRAVMRSRAVPLGSSNVAVEVGWGSGVMSAVGGCVGSWVGGWSVTVGVGVGAGGWLVAVDVAGKGVWLGGSDVKVCWA